MNRIDEGEVLAAHMAETNNVTINALAVTCVSVLMVMLVTVIEFIDGTPSPEILSRLGMLHVCVLIVFICYIRIKRYRNELFIECDKLTSRMISKFDEFITGDTKIRYGETITDALGNRELDTLELYIHGVNLTTNEMSPNVNRIKLVVDRIRSRVDIPFTCHLREIYAFTGYGSKSKEYRVFDAFGGMYDKSNATMVSTYIGYIVARHLYNQRDCVLDMATLESTAGYPD